MAKRSRREGPSYVINHTGQQIQFWRKSFCSSRQGVRTHSATLHVALLHPHLRLRLLLLAGTLSDSAAGDRTSVQAGSHASRVHRTVLAIVVTGHHPGARSATLATIAAVHARLGHVRMMLVMMLLGQGRRVSCRMRIVWCGSRHTTLGLLHVQRRRRSRQALGRATNRPGHSTGRDGTAAAVSAAASTPLG